MHTVSPEESTQQKWSPESLGACAVGRVDRCGFFGGVPTDWCVPTDPGGATITGASTQQSRFVSRAAAATGRPVRASAFRARAAASAHCL